MAVSSGEEEETHRGVKKDLHAGAVSSDDSLPPLVSNHEQPPGRSGARQQRNADVFLSSDDELPPLSQPKDRPSPKVNRAEEILAAAAEAPVRSIPRPEVPRTSPPPEELEDDDSESELPPLVSGYPICAPKGPDPTSASSHGGDNYVPFNEPSKAPGRTVREELHLSSMPPRLRMPGGDHDRGATDPQEEEEEELEILPPLKELPDSPRKPLREPLRSERDQELTQDAEELRAARSRVLSSRRVGDKHKLAMALLEYAEIQMLHNKPEEALQSATEAKGLFRELFAGMQEAEASRLVTKAHCKAGRPSEALERAQLERAHFKDAGDRRAEGMILLALADAHQSLNDLPLASRYAEQALEIFSEVEEVRGQAKAWAACCTIYSASERWDRVIRVASQAEDKLENCDELWYRAQVLMCASTAHLKSSNIGDPDKALDLARIAERHAKEHGDKRAEAAALRCMAAAYFAREEPREGLNAVGDAKDLSERMNDERGIFASCVLSAQALVREDQEEALIEQKTALKIAREFNDTKLVKEALEIAWSIHVANELPEKALELMEGEVRMAKKAGSKLREAVAHIYKAKVRMGQERTNDAFKALEEAARLCREAGSRKDEADARHSLAEAYVEVKQSDKAMDASREAETIYRALNDVQGIVRSLQLQVTLLVDEGEGEQALPLCEQQVKVNREAGFAEEEAAAQLGVAEITAEIRGSKEAVAEAKKARLLFKEMDDKGGEINCLIHICMHLANCQSLHESLQAAKEARLLAQKIDDVGLECEALQVAGEVHMIQGSLNEALRQSNLAVRVAREARDQRQEAENTKRTAELYLQVLRAQEEAGRPSDPRYLREAMEVIRSSREAFDAIGDKYGEAAALRVMSSIHLVQHEGDKAHQEAEQALQICAGLEDYQGMGSSYLSISKAQVEMGEYEEGIAYAHEAETVFKQTGDKRGLEECEMVIKVAEDAQRRGPLRRSQSQGRRLGQNSRDPGYHDRGDEGRGSRGPQSSPSSYGPGRSRSVPPEDFFADSPPTATSSSPGKFKRDPGLRDSPPLPKSLNGLKGPTVGSVGPPGQALEEFMASRGGSGKSFGFGRVPTHQFGFEQPDGKGPSGASAMGFMPRALDLEGLRSGERRPVREVDGLD